MLSFIILSRIKKYIKKSKNYFNTTPLKTQIRRFFQEAGKKKSQLQEEHKEQLIQFFDEYPHARVSDVVDELAKSFEGFSPKETVVGKFISTECNLSIKKSYSSFNRKKPKC
ncbi:uncharacterized protein BX663DRAFT_485845 [Cokeromyces recurvatus]|uniref:uncharacterized protein n=1 Tax=Cokeromyces recurvatus TaxID=90255 RepID=UPI00221F5B1B|nr:uncharacterized protein BX663DRAFT_485845 [Cokeromyces recurvatus]KAI7903744.1 hypothetical protein BX663DRAFT_485845 [Cokeromyces recurvatus]